MNSPESLYQFMLDASADATYLLSEKNLIVYANDAACATLEYSREELLGLSFFDVTPHLTEAQLIKLRGLARPAANKPAQFQTQHICKSGRAIEVAITSTTFLHGDAFFHVCIAKDITDQKQVEHERALLKFAFDHNHASAFLIEESGRFSYVNNALCELLGYTQAELLSMYVFDVSQDMLPHDWPGHWQELKKAGSLTFESSNRTKDGKVIPVEISANHFEFDGKGYNIGITQDITERKHMQANLIRREQEFRSLAENLPDNIARWDTQGRYLFANNLLAEMFGKPVEQLLGKSAYELFPDDQFAEVGMAIFRVIGTRQPQAIRKLSFYTENGELRHDDLSFVPEFDGDGRLVSILSIGRNMTEHYKMQEEIEQKRKLYHFLAENIPANIILWDREARYLYVNSHYADQSVHKPADELIGKTVDEAFPDGRFNATREIVQQVVQTKETVSLKKLPITLQDNSVQLHDVQLIPQLDENGRVQGVLGVGFDMSEHYRMQDEIRAKEDQLRHTIETLPGAVGIFHLGADGKPSIPYMSPHSKGLFGLDHEAIMKDSRPLIALIHPKDRKKVQQGMMQSIYYMSPWREEYRINHPTRKERWVESQATPARHPDGGIQWYGYIHDITERKKFEKQAGLAYIGQLSAGITHEINTPLTYIKGRLELMHYSVDDMPESNVKTEFQKDLHSIQDGVVRMSRIIQSMREIAGKSTGIKEVVDIHSSFIVTLTMIHNRAKYITTIYLNGEPFSLELQNSGKPYQAFVEKQRIEQVWIIILNNALDALEQNKNFDENRIDISVEESAEGIAIRIADNAGGIPDELLPVIFDPFTSTKVHGGMGLGLNIAKRIIDEQGGTIGVKNTGKGAEFTLTLPPGRESRE